MLRALLFYLSEAVWARKVVMGFPLARRVARRFVAGETCKDAVEAIRPLNQQGITATADHLGENVANEAEARRAAKDYIALIDCLDEAGVDSWISLKLTQLGLDLSETLCLELMRRILDHAHARNLVVTIDMEGSAYTQSTLTIFHVLHDEDGYQNVRVVVQSYLYRNDDDVDTLVESGAGVRLVKGAYREPPEIAYPDKADTDAGFVRQMKALLDATKQNGGYPAIATHDDAIIDEAKEYVAGQEIPPDAYEFQMLHGIRRDMQTALVEEGYRMRVYVPYGTEWYPYFMRRLAERPANLLFFVANLFRR